MAVKVALARFRGGPEDGLTQTWTVPPPLPKGLNWGGDIYNLVSVRPATQQGIDEIAVYRFNGEATKFQAGGITAVTTEWTRLMRALAHTGPKQLRRIHTSTARVRRMTRNHR